MGTSCAGASIAHQGWRGGWSFRSRSRTIFLFKRGPDVSFANCGLPYYIGGWIAEREKLLVTKPVCCVPASKIH
jgi:hypothetical protein